MLPIVEIIRLEEATEGTFGVMKINKQPFCVTLEPTDEENASNISSIPAQQYICKRVISPKYGDVFEITKVPGRTHVLIHPGNVIEHTEGCVLVAQYFGKLKGQRSVNNSGNTYKEFMKIMAGVTVFHLTVNEVY